MALIASFSGSNSSKSINKKLGRYANSLVEGHEIVDVNLEQYDAPIFSLDLEASSGVPDSIKSLRGILLGVDGFMITCPEHNGSVPAFFKNIIDWISRCDEGSIFNDKPVMIMTTSPGGRGGAGVRAHLVGIIPHLGAKSVHDFGLGKFYDAFDVEKCEIKDSEEVEKLKSTLNEFIQSLN